jgi:hypothetical protein
MSSEKIQSGRRRSCNGGRQHAQRGEPEFLSCQEESKTPWLPTNFMHENRRPPRYLRSKATAGLFEGNA